MKILEIYTDGSFKPLLNKGSCGFVVTNGKEVLQEKGFLIENGTNNVMELLGVIRAMEWVETNAKEKRVYIHTDSQYVQLGLTEWIHSWKKNNWRTSSKKDVANQEYWMRLDKLRTKCKNVQFQWIRGHNNNKFNVIADQLCEKMYNTKTIE